MVATISITIITLLLLVSSIIFKPNIKIKNITIPLYALIVFIGAVLLLITGSVPIAKVSNVLFTNTNYNPLKILVLFLSMTFISVFLDEAGFFSFVAIKCVQKIKTSQLKLFTMFYFLVALLTIFTSNDIVILTMTPFICYLCKNLKINPIPYLVGEFAAANTWSMLFIIGNPTNIYLASNFNIDFISFFKVMAVPTLLTGLCQFGLLLLIFNKKLKHSINPIDIDNYPINKTDSLVGLIVLGICLIALILSSYIPQLEMWIASFACFGLLFLYSLIKIFIYKDKILIFVLKSLPYNLIPFVLSMFVIVLAIDYQGISESISSFLGNNQPILVYGTTSYLTCNIMNNIPMSILYSKIISVSSTSNYQMAYASIIGSNLGAFLTPVGALAGIMFTDLIKKQNVRYTFIDFIKYGVMISLPCLFIALFSLMLFI